MNLKLSDKFTLRYKKSKTYNNLNEMKSAFDKLPENEKKRIAELALKKYESEKAKLDKFNARNSDKKYKEYWTLTTHPVLALIAAAWIGNIAAEVYSPMPGGLLGLTLYLMITGTGLLVIDGCAFDEYKIYINKHPLKMRKHRKMSSAVKESKETVTFLTKEGYLEQKSDDMGERYITIDKKVGNMQIRDEEKCLEEVPEVPDAISTEEKAFNKSI